MLVVRARSSSNETVERPKATIGMLFSESLNQCIGQIRFTSIETGVSTDEATKVYYADRGRRAAATIRGALPRARLKFQ